MKRGSVNHDVRVTNGKVVTNLLFRNEPMTKQELTARTGMSLQTITTLLGCLSDRGLITQGRKQQSTGGRPPTHILPVYSAAYSIGAYVSANHVRFCLIDLAPRIIAKVKYPIVLENTSQYWENVRELYLRFKTECGVEGDKLLGLGIAMRIVPRSPFDSDLPGIFTLNGSEVMDIDVNYLYSAFPDVPIELRGDAKAAALAQVWSNTGFNDFVYLSINNNIAGAIVQNRAVVGFDLRNAEFGHLMLQRGGRQCVCGRSGCFDAYCSASSLASDAGLALPEFFEQVEQGDARCREIWDEYLRNLAYLIGDIRVSFDVDIVIGGIVSQYLTRWREDLVAMIRDLHHPLNMGTFTDKFMHISDLGEYGSAMGAGLVLNDKFLSSIF